MTKGACDLQQECEDIAGEYVRYGADECAEKIWALVTLAVEAERKRCADIALSYQTGDMGQITDQTAQMIARGILKLVPEANR